MKNRWHLAATVLCLAVLAPPAPAQREEDPDHTVKGAGWPRQYEADNGSKVVIYQPQLESWESFQKLTALAAVAVTPPDGGEQILGSLNMTMDTATDHAARLVTLRNITYTEVNFPTVDEEQNRKALEWAQRTLPTDAVDISLDPTRANRVLFGCRTPLDCSEYRLIGV